MNELTARIISPINTRARKFKSNPLSSSILTPEPCRTLLKNTIEWTEEQSIIQEKAKMRVLEARMSRFTGFKSPRILLSKLIDQNSTSGQYNYDIINPVEVTEEVQKNEKVKHLINRRLQNKDLTVLSL